MRIKAAEESRSLHHNDMPKFVKERNFELVSALTRCYYNAMEILNKNTCPDQASENVCYSVCSDVIRSEWWGKMKTHQVYIGEFNAHGNRWLHLGNFFGEDNKNRHFGALPIVPAKVLKPKKNVNLLPAVKSLLQDLGIVRYKDYSNLLGCRPEHLQKIGLLSPEDFHMICSICPSNLDSLLIETQTADLHRDLTQSQRKANERKNKLVEVLDAMSQRLKEMTDEVKNCGEVLYESGYPWADLEEELKAMQTELEGLVEKCDGPRQLVETFNPGRYNAWAVKLNSMIAKFNQQFPTHHRQHQIIKLHTYINQYGILKVWNRRRTEGYAQNVTSLMPSEKTLSNLFHMGE